MSKNYFIGIDIGGSVVKAVLFDEKGQTVAVGHRKFRPVSDHPGHMEKDMNEVWDAAKDILKQISDKAGSDVENIRAIGLTGAGYGAWLIDADGNPVRRAIAYEDDRAKDIVRRWYDEGIADRYYEITGSGLMPGATPPFIRWFKDNEPEVLKESRYVLSAQQWLHYKLTGVISTDETGASIAMGDLRKNEYSDELFDLLGIAEYKYLFPPIRTAFEITGTILPEVAKEVGLPDSILVNNSPTDINTCVVGAGVIDEGVVNSNPGTAHGNLYITNKPELENSWGDQTMALDSPNTRYVHSVLTCYGAPSQDWFIDNFCGEDKKEAEDKNISIYDLLAERVAEIPAGSDGVLWNPLRVTFGEGIPFANLDNSGFFVGIKPYHTRYHLLNAVYEGDALTSRRNMERSKVKARELVLSGGMSSSERWCQAIVDVFNVPGKILNNPEACALGAAIHAALAAGYFKTLREAVNSMVSYRKTYLPDPDAHERYEKLYGIFTKLYDDLGESWHKIEAWQKEYPLVG